MRLGLLEMVRAPGRFAPVLAAISLLVGLVLAFSGIGTSHVDDLNGAVARSSADVLVLAAGAEGALQASRVDGADVEVVAALPEIAEAAPIGEARVGGRVDGDLYDVSLWGAGPGGPGAPEVIKGRPPEALGEAVIDIADAHLGLGIGATLEVADTDDRLTIVGLTEDRRFASIPTVVVTYEQWEAILNAIFADSDGVEPAMIAVTATDGVTPERAAAAIDALDAALAADVPPSLAAGLPGVAGVRASFAAATLVALIAVSAVTGLFFLLSVAHRRRAYEVLRAVGASRGVLVRALATQAVALVVLASLLGGGLVAVAAAVAPPRVPLSVSFPLLAIVTIAALMVTLTSALGSVRGLRKLDPAAALARRP